MNRIIALLLVWFVLLPVLLLQHPMKASAVLSDTLLAYTTSPSLIPVIVELKEPGLIDHPLIQKTRYFGKGQDSARDVDLPALHQALIDYQQQWIISLQNQPISFFYRASCQYIGNFVFLYIKGTDLHRLASHASVQSVLLDWEEKPLRKIMGVSTGANKVWNGTAGSVKGTGKGVKIGIIDSGIDFNHVEFEKKIIKGADFTSDENYKDDGIGHGTHVAGIAAGLGSTQYGKGMAYEGLLYVYKVFPKAGGGSLGSDVFQALDMAVADRVDVVNMSLGHAGDAKAKEGNLYYSIIQKVIKANVFVVAAIGNSGARGKEVPWPASSPGVVEDVFCVAASNDRKYSPTLYSDHDSFPYSPLSDLSLSESFQLHSDEVVDVGYGRLEDYSVSSLEGKVFLIARGPEGQPLSFSEKYRNALAYHPKAILFYASERLPGATLSRLERSILSSGERIPVLMIQQSDAMKLLEKKQSSNSTLYYADNGIGIADFSSMGPTSDGVFKPDISAPGVDVLSTYLKQYGGYAAASGTSMASPSVTGLVALLKELKPAWTMNQIKSSLMNNADIIFNPINQEPITYTLQGAGQARIDKAVMTEAFLTPRAFIAEDKEAFTQEITIQNAKSTDLSISSFRAEVFGLANEAAIQIETPSKPVSLKANESIKITVQFTIQEKLFRRSKYEGNIWINQMHIPFIIYKDTTEIENQTAVKNPISDLQIEKTDLFSCDAVTTNRIEFAFNTGSEQKFEGQIQYSNFGTIRLYLCDQQGLEWIVKPIIEFKQCPVGCYAYEWNYQEFIRENSIPNGTYRLKVSSSASQSFELLSDPLRVYDSPEPTLGTLFMGIPKNQAPESQVTFQLSAMISEECNEIEYTFYYDDSKLNMERVDLNPAIKPEEPPIIKSNYVRIVIPSSKLPMNERFYIGSLQATTSKKIGPAVFSHKILLQLPGQKQKVRIHGFLPELTITKKGDLNCDIDQNGKTDIGDFFLLTKKMGLDYQHPDFESSCDVNQDKSIDVFDYNEWMKEFSK